MAAELFLLYRMATTACKMLYDLFFFTRWDEYDDSDNEEEEDLIQLHITRLRHRLQQEKTEAHTVKRFVEETIFRSSDREFQSHFRITRGVFTALLRRVAPHIANNHGVGKYTIDPEKQLLAVLWLLATPDSYRSVANRFDISKSTLFECFVRIIKTLNYFAPMVITWPHEERAAQVEAGFQRMAGIPGIIGAVDGTYVPIKAPHVDNPQVYINRKCFYGITLQGICDHERKFTDVFVGYPSSVSDVRIFRNSDIYQQIIDNPNNYFGPNKFIIGDKAYPILSWCVPPYINNGNLQDRHTHFNTLHAKSRQIIERTFALLFGRMRRLQYLDMNRLDLIPSTIVAACVLHNICLEYTDDNLDEYEQEGLNYVQGENEGGNEVHHANMNEDRNNGRIFRDRLARLLY